MERTPQICPVEGCPHMKEPGALFCPDHWMRIKPADQAYLQFYHRHSMFGTLRRMVDAQAKIFAHEDSHPTPLTGVARRTQTPQQAQQ